MAPLCKEFGISRVTGHKIWKRYQHKVEGYSHLRLHEKDGQKLAHLRALYLTPKVVKKGLGLELLGSKPKLSWPNKCCLSVGFLVVGYPGFCRNGPKLATQFKAAKTDGIRPKPQKLQLKIIEV